MTLNSYIDEVKIILRENKDESFLDDRLLERMINAQRVLFIKNEINNNKTVQDSIIQTLSNLKLSPIKVYDQEGGSFIYLKTDSKIPKPVNYKERLGIESVEIDRLIGSYLTPTREDMIKYTGSLKHNGKDIYYFYKDNYIYIKVPKANFKASLITHLNIRAVFETPTLLANYADKEGYAQYDKYNGDYPINDALWEYMLGAIVEKLGLTLRIPETLENDQRNTK
ncbi:hypothetical protein KAU11_10715 [Candidatus Babeliales bacterium]|nr:hypothetical protein [Candidatus Babeliales bacterium]